MAVDNNNNNNNNNNDNNDNDKISLEFKKLGLKISYYRKLNGMTQEKLAEQMDVTTSYIGAIEAPNMHKTISLTTLFRIAEILKIPAWKLLKFDD